VSALQPLSLGRLRERYCAAMTTSSFAAVIAGFRRSPSAGPGMAAPIAGRAHDTCRGRVRT